MVQFFNKWLRLRQLILDVVNTNRNDHVRHDNIEGPVGVRHIFKLRAGSRKRSTQRPPLLSEFNFVEFESPRSTMLVSGTPTGCQFSSFSPLLTDSTDDSTETILCSTSASLRSMASTRVSKSWTHNSLETSIHVCKLKIYFNSKFSKHST